MISHIILRCIAIALGGGLWSYQTYMVIENGGGWNKIPLPHLAGTCVLTATLAATLPLAEYCWRKRDLAKAVGLGLLFLILVGGTLPDVISRTGEARKTKIAEATISANTVLELSAEHTRAKARVDDMEAERKRECASGFGPKCDNATRAVSERQERVDRLGRDIVAMVPKSGPGDTVPITGLLSPLGVTAQAYETYQPLFRPVAIEFGVWVMLWIGFAPMKRSRRKPDPVKPVIGDAPKQGEPDPIVQALLASGKPFLTNDELAEALGISKSAASKAVSARPHLVHRQRTGREVQISVTH